MFKQIKYYIFIYYIIITLLFKYFMEKKKYYIKFIEKYLFFYNIFF